MNGNPIVFSLAYRMLASVAEAEDIVQEALGAGDFEQLLADDARLLSDGGGRVAAAGIPLRVGIG